LPEKIFPIDVRYALRTFVTIRDPEKHAEALRMWNPSDVPRWLDQDFIDEKFFLAYPHSLSRKIRLALEVSHPYATLISHGEKIPHPGHWHTLAGLVGIVSDWCPQSTNAGVRIAA